MRVAATLPFGQINQVDAFHDFLDNLGIARTDYQLTTELFPLHAAITDDRRRFTTLRARQTQATQWFPCA